MSWTWGRTVKVQISLYISTSVLIEILILTFKFLLMLIKVENQFYGIDSYDVPVVLILFCR